MRTEDKRRYTSARERAEKQKSNYTSAALKIPPDVQLFQPKPGRYLLDILPYAAGEGNPWADEGQLHWERTYYAHRGVGANNDTFVCPRVTAKQRCPICELRLKIMKEGDEEKEQLVKDMSPKQRQIFNVINRKDPDKGVQIWDVSYHLFGKALDARLRNSDEEDEWDKFFFLEGGSTLKVAFVEKTFGGFAFVEVEAIDFRQREEDYDSDILKKVQCLDELLVIPSYDALKKTFLETQDEDDDEEEDDEPKSRTTPAAKKHKHKEDEDDEPEDEDEDEDEEEDEPPKKKKKKPAGDDWDDFDEEEEETPKKSKKKTDDEDDEDEEPEEDEEDEPPKKKSAFPRGKGKVTSGDDDEDEEEDEEEPEEEDDEEDEPPKKKKGK